MKNFCFLVFEKMKARLPVGFAVFHVPYVLEWYTDRRQYKQAYEMVRKYGGIYSCFIVFQSARFR